MPYDYAREIDDARAHDPGDDESPDEIRLYLNLSEPPDENGDGPEECTYCGQPIDGEHACNREP